MLITPLAPQKPRQWALLTPGYKSLIVRTSEGLEAEYHGPKRCWDALSKLGASGHVCYVRGRLADMRKTTDPRDWTADLWRGHPTTMKLVGTKFVGISLRSVLKDSQDPMADLHGAFDWLSDHGIRPGSLSSMAWALWRSTLDLPVQASFQSKVGRAAFYGGRQEARPQNYRNMVQLDIAQAYPHAMQSSPYAVSLMEVSPLTKLDPDLPGLARCIVQVPGDLAHPPLPYRVDRAIIQWQWGTLKGTWTWRELAAAQQLGCAVHVERCWAPTDLTSPFDQWYQVQSEGRSLEAGASLIKALSTSLWGMFGMTADDTAACRWGDEAGEMPIIIPRAPRPSPHANLAHWAAETASRPRTRVLMEGLYGGIHEAPAHIDTDGILVESSRMLPPSTGEEPGQWRIKSQMRELEVRGPQVYRYRCTDGCGIAHLDWHYVTAGIPPREAERLFDRQDNSLNVGVGGIDFVVPRGLNGAGTAKEYAAWADRVHTTIYGAPMVDA